MHSRPRLAKYVKYKAFSFLFLFFSNDSPTVSRFLRTMAHITRNHAIADVPFWSPHNGRPHLGVKFPKNPLKRWPGQAIQAKFEKNDNFNIFKTE